MPAAYEKVPEAHNFFDLLIGREVRHLPRLLDLSEYVLVYMPKA